jgi:hypothetical protein
MNWNIQSYTTDVGDYFVTQRGVGDWIVLDASGTLYDGFADQNAAMAFAESLYAQRASPDQTPIPNPTVTSVPLA